MQMFSINKHVLFRYLISVAIYFATPYTAEMLFKLFDLIKNDISLFLFVAVELYILESFLQKDRFAFGLRKRRCYCEIQNQPLFATCPLPHLS